MTSDVGDEVGDEHMLMHVLMSGVHMSMLSVGGCIDQGVYIQDSLY